MDEQELEQKIESIVEDYLDELEIEQFAEDTANVIVELKHKLEDIEDKI